MKQQATFLLLKAYRMDKENFKEAERAYGDLNLAAKLSPFDFEVKFEIANFTWKVLNQYD